MNDAVFPLRDPVGPATPGLGEHSKAQIAEFVAPFANDADAHGVRRSTIDQLAGAGLLGTPMATSENRELIELIAGSDASTWFCWVQHFTPLRTLENAAREGERAGELFTRTLPKMRTGEMLAAVAFAHVRRPGPANPTATRVDGGWRLDGSLDWVTSWDIADVVMVMARGIGGNEGSLVCAFLPAGRSLSRTAGVVAGERLSLLAMGGTHTRPVMLDAAFIADEQIAAVLDRDVWLAQDAITAADANPAVFGVTRGAIAELDLLAEQRSDPSMAELVDAMVDECRSMRARVYAGVDDRGASVDRRLALRAECLDMSIRAANAVVVARAGAAMRTGHSAERRLRESAFLQVQAQTAASRRSSLALLTARSG